MKIDWKDTETGCRAVIGLAPLFDVSVRATGRAFATGKFIGPFECFIAGYKLPGSFVTLELAQRYVLMSTAERLHLNARMLDMARHEEDLERSRSVQKPGADFIKSALAGSAVAAADLADTTSKGYVNW